MAYESVKEKRRKSTNKSVDTDEIEIKLEWQTASKVICQGSKFIIVKNSGQGHDTQINCKSSFSQEVSTLKYNSEIENQKGNTTGKQNSL